MTTGENYRTVSIMSSEYNVKILHKVLGNQPINILKKKKAKSRYSLGMQSWLNNKKSMLLTTLNNKEVLNLVNRCKTSI